MKSHKDLEVWQLAVELAVAVNSATRTFPKDEQFGLCAQMRRSAVSIASNIAEGAARHGKKEFLQFLYVSLGSASELETQIEIASRVGLGASIELKQPESRSTSISKMLLGLIRSIKARHVDSKESERP